MTSAPSYAVSVNKGIIDKPGNAKGIPYGYGWDSVEVSEQDLERNILQGWATAPQFKGGRRKTGYFNCAGFLAADIDAGMSLDEAKEQTLVRHHAGLIHTTASHSDERHRFRIFFLLEVPITSAQDWADAQLGIALQLESDRSVTDAARLFYGNTRAAIFRISRTVPPHVVADMIARGRAARESGRPIDGRLLPLDSARRIPGPELIKLATGQSMRMDELGANVRVHCPNHDDADPSAFTVRSTKGSSIGIHCMACKSTFWLNGQHDDYNFGAFDRLFEELRLGNLQPDPNAEGFDRFFPLDPKFEKLQERFLPALAYEPGITLVKSPKGSGKTEALRGLIRLIRADMFRAGITHREKPRSILLVGHRRSLITEAAKKLGLWCYLDKTDRPRGAGRTLAVCLDSLPKFNESYLGQARACQAPHDLVIIDESEQVFSHLVGETIESRCGIERCYDALYHEISQAKAVIALDADLGLVTTHALRTMRRQEWASRCRIVYNEPIVPVIRRKMRLFRHRKRLDREVIEAVRAGQRCFIVSNSKTCVKTIHRMIENECGADIKVRVITSDNSRDEPTREFLENITAEILKVQVVIASPSIGTGIDITFADGVCLVDRVFGYFYPFINTHTDIDQQLARVRNPGAIDVWVSRHTFSYTSNIDVIMDDLARAYTVRRAVLGRAAPDGRVEYDRQNPLLMICAHVTAQQRASKNRLLHLFSELRESNGWSVEPFDEGVSDSAFDKAKIELAVERAEALADAPRISDADFIELDERAQNGAALSSEERIIHEKNHFERTVGLPLATDLIERNADGRLLDRIETLSEIVSVWRNDQGRDYFGELVPKSDKPFARLSQMCLAYLLAVLMRVAGLSTAEGFNLGVVISSFHLVEFVRLCRTNKTVIEEISGQAIRCDLEKKPVKHLNLFLRQIGLQLDPMRTEKVDGKKIRFYTLPVASTRRMVELARSHLEVKSRREAEKEEG